MRTGRFVGILAVVAGVGSLVVWPEGSPGVVGCGLLLALIPLVRVWRAADGTALRAAVTWGFVALGLGLLGQVVGWNEPLATGRPLAGHLVYLEVLATLAALISVLGARNPGGGAWAILMAMLLVVFLIPWLEGAGLARGARVIDHLRLDSPWTIFYGLLVVAGVTNHLPTRYFPAAACLGIGFVLEYLALTRLDWSPTTRGRVWTIVPWLSVTAIVLADRLGERATGASDRLVAFWFWFRDHWGVVWALRVLERFNRSAELQGWPFRLAWHGLVDPETASEPAEITPEQRAAAEKTLVSLLRRFVSPERLSATIPSEPNAGAGKPTPV